MNAEVCMKSFLISLREEERSRATLRKYEHDIRLFLNFLMRPRKEETVQRSSEPETFSGTAILRNNVSSGADDFPAQITGDDFPAHITKEDILLYKEDIREKYAAASVNSMLVAVNRFLLFIGRGDLRVRLLRIQRQAFRNDARALSRKEYMKLLRAAKKKDHRLFLLMETICSTGIRVSEHKFITVESLKCGRAEIHNKGKTRIVLMDSRLTRELLRYCKRRNNRSGPVFVSVNGNPLDRSYIWRKMKEIGRLASVAAEKIFPHNLRHLFAVTFYRETGDIAHLADLLGHASIDTTRIYTSLSVADYNNCFCRMKLLLC